MLRFSVRHFIDDASLMPICRCHYFFRSFSAAAIAAIFADFSPLFAAIIFAAAMLLFAFRCHAAERCLPISLHFLHFCLSLPYFRYAFILPLLSFILISSLDAA